MKSKNMIHSSVLATAAAALLLSVAGCDKNDANKNGTSTTPSSTTTSSTSSNSRTDNKSTTPPNADNTANNKDHDVTKTPQDQGQNAADVKITAEIRRAIMDDKALSTNAKNCKVITMNGVVTLRGPVDTLSEKDSVEAKANAVAGVASVDNQLEVKMK